MCIAAPGRIVEITDNTAVIEYGSNRLNAHVGIVDAKVGDWALVHAGLVIQKLDREEAENMTELFEAIREIENG